jgi:hypothetical protein
VSIELVISTLVKAAGVANKSKSIALFSAPVARARVSTLLTDKVVSVAT